MADLPQAEVFLSNIGPNWVRLSPDADADESQAELFAKAKDKTKRQLSDVLLSENLIVLTGLGTSLCLQDEFGNNIAPTMGDLWTAAKALTIDKLVGIKQAVKFTGPNDIEKLLSRCQMAMQFDPDATVEEFVSDAEKMIVEKVRFVDGTTDLSIHESFLRRVARRSTRLPRLKLFTTNYDLCFEQAASRTRFIVIDGFSHTQPQEFDGGYFNYDLVRRHQDRETPDFIPNVFHLYKLHGSVDWKSENDQILRDPNVEKPLLIFPRESKFQLSYDQPFLEMMSRLQMAIRQPNTGILIVGFGFNDHHIAQPLISAIRSNISLKAVIVDPFLKDSTNTFHREIVQLIEQGDTRLALLAMSFADAIPLIPDLVAESEEEQHRGRLSGSRGGHV
jgi:hypothetical protein